MSSEAGKSADLQQRPVLQLVVNNAVSGCRKPGGTTMTLGRDAPAVRSAAVLFAIGARGPITVSIEPLTRRALETHWQLHGGAGVCVQYRGHKEDLVAAGCVKLEGVSYDWFCDDGHGGLFWVTSRAGPGKRGQIAVSYYTNQRGFAASLPGVLQHFAYALDRLTARSQLRVISGRASVEVRS